MGALGTAIYANTSSLLHQSVTAQEVVNANTVSNQTVKHPKAAPTTRQQPLAQHEQPQATKPINTTSVSTETNLGTGWTIHIAYGLLYFSGLVFALEILGLIFALLHRDIGTLFRFFVGVPIKAILYLGPYCRISSIESASHERESLKSYEFLRDEDQI